MVQVNVTDLSEPVYGVLIGDRINVWISRATKEFMDNYEPDSDMEPFDYTERMQDDNLDALHEGTPDWEGTIDHADLCSPDEPDGWDEVR